MWPASHQLTDNQVVSFLPLPTTITPGHIPLTCPFWSSGNFSRSMSKSKMTESLGVWIFFFLNQILLAAFWNGWPGHLLSHSARWWPCPDVTTGSCTYPYFSHFIGSPFSNIYEEKFFVCVWLGFELKASHLQSRHSTAWAMPLSPFCSGYFEDGGIFRAISPGCLEPQSSQSHLPK
jgi:hypothetical protein